MFSFVTPHPITAVIEIRAGQVRLVADERVDTEVSVRPHDESRPEDVEAAQRVRVEFGDGTLTVTGDRAPAVRGAVVVEIALPTGSRLHASLASARLIAEGRYADCRLASASGDLVVDEVRGALNTDTASGAAAVRRLCGAVEVRSASGRLTVERLDGRLTARTASGDVAVTSAVRGSISVHTASGGVRVGVAEGTAAKLDLHTGSGSVRNGLRPSAGPVDGDETLTVHAQTASGDVVVHRGD
ncbi:DUF4097 family beta strand repeat-containing protein [Mycolicibacterium sp. XJ1819]